MCDRHGLSGALAGVFARPEAAQPIPAPPPPAVARPAPRRLKLWELEDKLHCPVIGTCLTLEDLKKIARKSGFEGPIDDAYRLHVEAVSLSCSRNPAAEAMQKRLEEAHALSVRQFSAARDDAGVLALWKQALESGAVAGAVWAALTHKAAGKATRQVVYADLHMLSHQVGAGQAADLRRLQALERDHARLRSEHASLRASEAAASQVQADLAREVADLRAQLRERDAQVAELGQRLQAFESGQPMVAMGRRLFLAEAQAARATELEARLGPLRADKARLARELEEIRAERDALEQLWSEDARPAQACAGDCDSCPRGLAGRCVLCVGGRAPLLPQYRQLAERLGVRLIHHDGGREEHLSRLPELLKASDAVICPTDCVGHLAYYQLKKHCKQSGKPCVLTRNSGVAGFAAALARLANGRADIHGQT